jgi:hypothetical protein
VATFYDKAKGFYRDGKGKEIPYKEVRGAVDKVADDAKERLRGLAEKFNAGKLDLPSWYTQSEQIIRRSLIASGQIGAGGRGQMAPSLNGSLGARVRFHLDKFRQFGLEIERGEVSDGEILNRAEMYGDATVNLFETVRLAALTEAGFTEARNILSDSAHCTQCPGIVGWIKIEDYIPPGSRICLTRCRCGTEYR